MPLEQEHPYPAGTRVFHSAQEWARASRLATAVVKSACGPYNDGSYEYDVLAGREFARPLSESNPMDRLARWNSACTGWALNNRDIPYE